MRFNQRWLVSLLGGLLLISLVGNGVLRMRQQQQTTARQTTRTQAAEQIRHGLAQASRDLNLAYEIMVDLHGDSRSQGWTEVHDLLGLAELSLHRSASIGELYAQMTPPAADVMIVVNSYATLLIPPKIEIDQFGAIRPETTWRITDLQSDLVLLQRLFPQDLLTDGSATDFHQAFLTFCTQRHIFIFGHINTRCTERRATPMAR